VVELELRGTEARDLVAADGLRLDAPRAGAVAIELDGHPIVVGGDDPELPVAWMANGEQASGPTTAWTALACATLSDDPPQALCVGGQRDGTPTADALRLELQGGSLHVEELPGLLPLPLPAPLLFSDDAAVHAQGEGRWLRIERADLVATELASAAPRAAGGSTAPLLGTTLLVGGVDLDGEALDRWYVFAPTVEP
jgi:hypothetical protein